jgi:hypothetical protein
MLHKVCRDPTLGEGGMPPCREGSCWVLRRLIQVCLTRGLVAVCIRLTHPPPALHFVGLTCCPIPAHCTMRAPWPKTPWMEEDCFGITQFHGMHPLQCVCGFRNSPEPRNSKMCLDFCNSMYSVIPGNSATPISWCRLFGCRLTENEINQMIVQECLPTMTSITVFTAQSTNRSAFTKG